LSVPDDVLLWKFHMFRSTVLRAANKFGRTTHSPSTLNHFKPVQMPSRGLAAAAVEYPVLWGTSMKALVKEKPAEGLILSDVPKPAIGPNDVLIKVSKAAICGTDVHIYNWDQWAATHVPTPMTIGHEYVGTIADMGKEVKGMKIGQRVTGEGHIT